jgi:surfeit locus 1 family protein
MRLSRGAIVLLAALLGAGVTGRLGLWQLDRAAQKNALQRTLDERRALPALPAAALAVSPAQLDAQVQRSIVVEGRWLVPATVYLDNRPQNGRTGFIVVTPLLLADGSAVAVQRGWLPRDAADRTHVAAPALPDGPVQVAGRIAPAPSRLLELGRAASGPIRQNIDLPAFAAEVGHPLRPLTIVQEDGPQTPNDGLLRQWPAPAADVQKHYGYAFQWFSMATLILGLYVWFQVIRPRRRR